MHAKRAPVASLMTPAATPEGADDRGSDEHSWLVFRLGPHTMCASTLDVEGIIEPKPATPLPFTPAHVLGTFMFRDRVATAISLRKKLGVRVGEDSAQGPFVVARVGDELAAFWVDEVKEVMGGQNVAWQPMPDMLHSRVFDRYTLASGELILHTSFASLLKADAESLPARWRVSPEQAPAGEEARPRQVAGVQAAAGNAQDDDQAPSTAGAAQPSPPELASAGPRGATDDGLPAPQGRGDRPPDLRQADPVGEDADRVRTPKAVPDGRTRLGGTARAASQAKEFHPAAGLYAAARARDPKARAARASAAEERRLGRGAATGGSGDHSSALSETAPRDDVRVVEAPDSRSTYSPDAIVEHGQREHRDRHPIPTTSTAASYDVRRKSPRARALGGIALAGGAVLVAMVALWSGSGNDAPPAAERADNSVRGPVVADLRPRQPASDSARAAAEPPVRLAPSDPVPGTVAPAKPAAATTRIATVETEAFSLTIERPAKASKTPGNVGAGTSAATSADRQISPGGVVHVVVRGDTLWDISRKYLGNPFRYPELVRLSGIENPNLIHPGDIVRIRVNNSRR